MTFERFNSINWKQGDGVVLRDGRTLLVTRRGTFQNGTMLYVSIENKPAFVYYRDVVRKAV